MLHSLAARLKDLKADLLVVSGDLTQRARPGEFRYAREFLDGIPSPRLIVPGNHDLAPWFKPIRRWRAPLANFCEAFGADLEPVYKDDEIVVIGVNTARRNTVEAGRLNKRQVERTCNLLRAVPADRIRFVVSHHPFDLPAHYRGHNVVGRAEMAMSRFAKSSADAFLSGHLHVSHIGETTLRYRIEGYSALVIQAGTAASTRVRGELNSWNLIRVARPRLAVEKYLWDSQRGEYAVAGRDEFHLTPEGWHRRAA